MSYCEGWDNVDHSRLQNVAENEVIMLKTYIDDLKEKHSLEVERLKTLLTDQIRRNDNWKKRVEEIDKKYYACERHNKDLRQSYDILQKRYEEDTILLANQRFEKSKQLETQEELLSKMQQSMMDNDIIRGVLAAEIRKLRRDK